MPIDGSTSDPLIDHCLPTEGVYGSRGWGHRLELVHIDAWNGESWGCSCFIEQEFFFLELSHFKASIKMHYLICREKKVFEFFLLCQITLEFSKNSILTFSRVKLF